MEIKFYLNLISNVTNALVLKFTRVEMLVCSTIMCPMQHLIDIYPDIFFTLQIF